MDRVAKDAKSDFKHTLQKASFSIWIAFTFHSTVLTLELLNKLVVSGGQNCKGAAWSILNQMKTLGFQ